MKKVILAGVLALVSIGTASAREVSVVGGYDFSDVQGAQGGLGYSETYGDWTVGLGWEHNMRDVTDSDRVSVVVARDMGLQVKGFPVLPKVGVAYVNPDGRARGGYAWLVGVGTRYDVNEVVSIGLDYRYQSGENDIRAWDGNQLLLSVTRKFN